MKESEKLRQEANQEDNDFVYMSKINKAVRQARLENFEENFVEKLKENDCILTKFDGKKVIIDTQKKEFGIVDYYPKANKILIRKLNKWKSYGLSWMKKNLIKNK